MLNHCGLTGKLGAAPEVFHSSEGNPVASVGKSRFDFLLAGRRRAPPLPVPRLGALLQIYAAYPAALPPGPWSSQIFWKEPYHFLLPVRAPSFG
jgi:hypothetical protein